MALADLCGEPVGTNMAIRTYRTLRWKAEPIIPSMLGVTGQGLRGRRVG
jgi:hypothetical protein